MRATGRCGPNCPSTSIGSCRWTEEGHGKNRGGALLALFLALSTVGLVACGGGGGSTGPDDEEDDSGQTVVTVEVSPDTAAASELGETVPFEAEARDADGNVVSDASFSWTSTDGSVATVDGQGTATAEANGAANIEATASGVTGDAYLAVRAGELDWVQIRAGNIFGCGVTTHGTAYCWGDNVHGELGDGNTTQIQAEPVKVRRRLYFRQLALGGGHTCALSFDGAAFCWGNTSAGEGGYGVSGQGVQTDPQEVSGGHSFREITASGNHTCAVRTDGAAYCWGRNAQGQLGIGSTVDQSTPAAVHGGLTFETVRASMAPIDNHTCGVTTGGDAYCWGVNFDGELGDGTTEERHEPVQVEADLEFAQISPGGSHTCAVAADGDVYCWGANGSGQLGDGTTEDRLEPVQVSGGFDFQLVTSGLGHTCGLTTDGTLYCWGANGNGQLGDGSTENRLVPTEVTGSLSFRHVEAGARHTCGVTTGDAGYCWGNNDHAQLGIGQGEASTVPVELPDPGALGG